MALLTDIGHAMYGNIEFKDGIPQATNFDKYRLLRANEAPKVEAFFYGE